MQHEEVASVAGIEAAHALHGVEEATKSSTDVAPQEVPHALDARVVHRAPRDERPALGTEATFHPILGLDLPDEHAFCPVVETNTGGHLEHVTGADVIAQDGLRPLVQVDLPKEAQESGASELVGPVDQLLKRENHTHPEPHDLARVAIHAAMDLYIGHSREKGRVNKSYRRQITRLSPGQRIA